MDFGMLSLVFMYVLVMLKWLPVLLVDLFACFRSAFDSKITNMQCSSVLLVVQVWTAAVFFVACFNVHAADSTGVDQLQWPGKHGSLDSHTMFHVHCSLHYKSPQCEVVVYL